MRIGLLVDASGSMGRVLPGQGLTFLDAAKSAAEKLIQARATKPGPPDAWFLAPGRLEWAGSDETLDAVRALVPEDPPGLGHPMLSLLDALNSLRFQSDVDHLVRGGGRLPWLTDPSVVVIITDADSGCTKVLEFLDSASKPRDACPGAEYFSEAVRWDQKVYCAVIGFDSRGIPRAGQEFGQLMKQQFPAFDDLVRLCERSGGECRKFGNSRSLNAWMEELAHRAIPAPGSVFPGFLCRMCSMETVVTRLAENPIGSGKGPLKLVNDSDTVFLKNSSGGCRWPLPENIFIEGHFSGPFVRDSLPLFLYELVVSTVDFEKFPGDRYVVDKLEATSKAFGHKVSKLDGKMWYLFCRGSTGENDFGKPFGIMRKHSSGIIEIIVLPYDFPMFIPLYRQVESLKHTPYPDSLRRHVLLYLKSVPYYYLYFLRSALNQANKYSDQVFHALKDKSTGIPSQLAQQFQNTKALATQLSSMIGLKRKGIMEQAAKKSSAFPTFRSLDAGSIHFKEVTNLWKKIKISLRRIDLQEEVSPELILKEESLLNERRFSLPVKDMGDFQASLRAAVEKSKQFRDPDPDAEEQNSANFGSRYRRKSKQMRLMAVDEADVDSSESSGPNSPGLSPTKPATVVEVYKEPDTPAPPRLEDSSPSDSEEEKEPVESESQESNPVAQIQASESNGKGTKRKFSEISKSEFWNVISSVGLVTEFSSFLKSPKRNCKKGKKMLMLIFLKLFLQI